MNICIVQCKVILMKKILFFLATEKGFRTLSTLIESEKGMYIGGVVSFHEINMKKDYYSDIEEAAKANNIPFFEWKDIKENIIDIICQYKITSCVAISWRYMLPLKINNYLEDNLIVFHDSLLPKYRGFAPLVTAMINGDRKVGVSVIYATDEVDAGEIIMQESFGIDEKTYINDAIKAMSILYAKLALRLVSNIVSENLISYKQDELEATYSIWRDEDDYWIDWNWSADEISRFVRALSYPYKGAKTIVGDIVVRILECCVEEDINFSKRQPGKVWKLEDCGATIVCGKGLVKVSKAVDEEGNIYVFKKLRIRLRSR